MKTLEIPSFKRLSITIIVTLVVGLCLFPYFKSYAIKSELSNNRLFVRYRDSLKKYDYQVDPQNILEKHQDFHRFPFDVRSRLAYEYTLELGAKIFSGIEHPQTKATVTWQNEGWQVKVQSQNIEREDHLKGKVPPLALVSYSQRELLGTILEKSVLSSNTPVSFAEVDQLIQKFDTVSILDALLELDKIMATGNFSPELFFHASRCYAWLAIFQPFDEMDISVELCAKALAYYNLGRHMGGEGQTEWLMILVAMGYWGEADQVVKETAPAGEEVFWQAISAYIHYDPISLKRVIEESPEPPYFYWLGLIYKTNSRYQEAAEVLKRAYQEHPECLQLLNVLARSSSVGPSHEYTEVYPELTLKRHLDYLEKRGETGWKEWAKAFWNGLKEKRYFSPQGELLKFWQRSESTTRFLQDRETVLLDIDTYKQLAKAEIFEALWVRYDFLLLRYAAHEEAKEFMEEIVQVYPDESFTQALQGLYYQYIGKHRESTKHFIDSLKYNPSQFVLENVINHMGLTEDETNLAYYALHLWRDKFSPKETLINGLADCYRNRRYYYLSNDYLKMSTELNPFYPWTYVTLTLRNKNSKFIEEGLKKNPHSYTLLRKAGIFYRNQNTPEGLKKAIPLLQKALKISPRSVDTYESLAIAYEKQGNYCKAVETFKAYLAYDEETLYAVYIKNKIGKIYLRQKDYQKAYEVFEEVAPTYQGSSLLGMAESLEGLKRMEEAEEYFKRGAERYPNYSSPFSLMNFYLRHNRDKEAKEAVMKYLPYNSINNFLDEMVDDFLKNKKAYRIWPAFQQIFGSPEYQSKIVYLAQLLNIKKEYEAALPVWEKFVELKPFGGWQHYLPKYYFCLEKTRGKEIALNSIKKYLHSPLDKHRTISSMYNDGVFEPVIQLGKELLSELPPNVPQEQLAGIVELISLAASKSGNEASVKDILDKWIARLNPKLDDVLCVKYLDGDLSEKDLLTKVTPQKVGMVAYYIGLKQLMAEKREQAESYFLITKEATLRGYGEYHWAMEELKKLSSIPVEKG